MIKRNLKLTPKEFLNKMLSQRKTYTLTVNTIRRLEEQWIKDHCPVKIGQEIPIQGQDGYTRFKVDKIHVEIDHEGGKKEGAYTIGFSYSGEYIGEGLENKPGRVRFKSSNPPNNVNETKKQTVQSGTING